GSGAAVAVVALQAAMSLAPASWRGAPGQARWDPPAPPRAGAAAGGGATVGAWLVLLLLGCVSVELALQRTRSDPSVVSVGTWPLLAAAGAATGGLISLVWVAFKVGALSYGGGFVIIPLMHHDAVDTYGWMSDGQFLNAVALGQVTPGPVVHTVAVVGYAAAGVGGGLLAALVAFSPSFLFVLTGADRFHALLRNARVRAFIDGAAPAALGAILGSAIPLALAFTEWWQAAILAAAALALLLLRAAVVPTLLAAGAAGVIVALAGA